MLPQPNKLFDRLIKPEHWKTRAVSYTNSEFPYQPAYPRNMITVSQVSIWTFSIALKNIEFYYCGYQTAQSCQGLR